MQINSEYEAKIKEAVTTITTEVDAISDLTPEQKAKVIDIATGYVKSHSLQLPNVAGIVNHVRSSK